MLPSQQVASLIVEVPGERPLEVRLDPEVVTVGRADNNTLALRDMNVSRHHFTIERRAQVGYVLRDRGSRNGTQVNGVSVLSKVLGPGDRIEAGGSRLTFRPAASGAAVTLERLRLAAQAPPTMAFGRDPAPPPEAFLPGPRETASPSFVPPGVTPPRAVVRPSGEPEPAAGPATRPATASAPGTPPGGPSPPAAEARWRKLAEVACAINVEHDLARLLERILDAVLELVPAKSAFLVLLEEDVLRVRANRGQHTVAVGTALDETGEQDALRLSRQVCRDAIVKRHPVLTQDAIGDSELGSYHTIMNLQLRSILCVPFAAQDEVLGVVYLDEPTCDPFEDDGEVVELVGAFGDLAGIAVANARLLAEVGERERLQEELRIATRIQSSLLPGAPPQVPGLELAGQNRPAREVGGDMYDFFLREAPARDLLVSIGDVAGKGVGAGLVMASVRALLRAYAEVFERTDELIRRLNALLSRDLDPGIFVSFLLLRFDPSTGALHYTGAGHEHLVLYRAATGELEFVRAGGIVLGLVPDLTGRVQERPLELAPGDVLCLYTDGATEAPGPGGEEFGLERVGEAVRAGPSDPAAVVERVMRAVEEFSAGPELHDDLTVVALRRV